MQTTDKGYAMPLHARDYEDLLLTPAGRRFYAVSMLELVSTERPAMLIPLITSLLVGRSVDGVCELWGIEPDELAEVALRTAKHLSRLERRQAGWRHPDQALDKANCQALASFAEARQARVSGTARSRRLGIVLRKCRRAADAEQSRRKLEAFIREPSQPIDLAAFMGWPDA